jgi:hypothetical protein
MNKNDLQMKHLCLIIILPGRIPLSRGYGRNVVLVSHELQRTPTGAEKTLVYHLSAFTIGTSRQSYVVWPLDPSSVASFFSATARPAFWNSLDSCLRQRHYVTKHKLYSSLNSSVVYHLAREVLFQSLRCKHTAGLVGEGR